MPALRQRPTTLLRICEILYLFTLISTFYLLLLSRTGEAHTVWEVLHPYFIPTLLVATFLLITILFTSEKVAYKLLFVMAHSILVHSFFSIIFPAGDSSGQQMVLGRIRLVFDNAVLHGWVLGRMEFLSQVYEWFRGITFQAALSVVFARMLSIDLLWVHLFLVPVLWGVFIPVGAFLTTKTLVGNENVAVLSSLLVSAFPYATYFGAISVSISLGFIFFFYSLYFMLKNLDSNDSKNKIMMLTFSFFSVLSHNLTGIVSLSLLVLSLMFKSYRSEKKFSPITAKVSLLIVFIFCSSLVPVSFIYLRFLRPATYPVPDTMFTLEKFYKLPTEEIVGLFFLGELIYGFDLKTILFFIIGPAIAIVWMILLLYNLKKNPGSGLSAQIVFLFVAFLMMLLDFRILTLFMTKLPINEERLWVFRDLMAAPFVALAIYGMFSSINKFLEAHSGQTISVDKLKSLSKRGALRVPSALIALILIYMLLTGWIVFSLKAAYPQVAPLQTTWYELEAVKYIEENTHEKYVVIGDSWTTFAGEVIVGVSNPRAYYFLEFNRTVYDLFRRMREDPSPQVMIEAMSVNNATIAYFILTEPRMDAEEFNRVVSQAEKNPQLELFGVFGEGKLYVFSYKKGD